MKWLGIGIGGLVVVMLGMYGWASASVSSRLKKTYAFPPVTFSQAVGKPDLKLGQYIVTVRNACAECHGKDLAGGIVLEDPAIAKIYGPNITPFMLKDWTDGEIAQAVRHGISRDGHPLRIMPSDELCRLSEDELAAVVAYVRSVPPVEKPSRQSHFGPIGTMLVATRKIPNALPVEVMDHAMPFVVKPPTGPTPEYGKYLYQTACLSCHREDLTGGPIKAGPPDWPPAKNLTPNALGTWSEQEFLTTLRTGRSPTSGDLKYPMKMISAYTRQYHEEDLKAIWAYLRSVPPGKGDW